jgi:threonyl-tRNA synthetase
VVLQVKGEIIGFLKMLGQVYGVFGLDYSLALSTRPEGYLGELELWNQAETALKESLNDSGVQINAIQRLFCSFSMCAAARRMSSETQSAWESLILGAVNVGAVHADLVCDGCAGLEWRLDPGEGAFYGPKIDITVYDALRRKFQCATVQLDFQLPIRFNLAYWDENQQPQKPVIVHRAILGSVERMFAILTEHYAQKWPFWLSPRQVMVVPISSGAYEYAQSLRKRLRAAKLHVDVDLRDQKMQKKVRLRCSQKRFVQEACIALLLFSYPVNVCVFYIPPCLISL